MKGWTYEYVEQLPLEVYEVLVEMLTKESSES